MAQPEIDTHTSILSIEEGGVFAFQPSARNGVDSWTASNLPDGLSINSSTGLINGTVTADSGLYNVDLTATNTDGEDTITLHIPIFDVEIEEVLEGEIAVEIDVNLITGGVSVEGMSGYDIGPLASPARDDGYKKAIMLVKEGDRFPVSIGFTRGGVLQDLDLRSLKLKGKEFLPGGVLNMLESDFEKVGEGSETRYRATLNISESVFEGVLSNTENDTNYYLDAFSEIEFTILISSNQYDETEVESNSLQGGQTITDTISFIDLPKTSSSTNYAIDSALSVTGASAQNVSLEMAADISFDEDSGIFSVSGITGTDSGQGEAATDTQWQSSFEVTGITGTDQGVDVTVETVASSLSSGSIMVLPEIDDWSIVNDEIYFQPYGQDYADYKARTIVNSNSVVEIDFTINAGNDAADLLSKFQNMGSSQFSDSVSAVSLVAGTGIILTLSNTSSLDEVGYNLDSEIYYPTNQNANSSKTTFHTVSVTGDAEDDVHRKTSDTFILRAVKDIIPDV